MSPLQGYIPLADRDSYNCVSRTLTRPGSKANPYWVLSALQLCFLQTCHPYRDWFCWPIVFSTNVPPLQGYIPLATPDPGPSQRVPRTFATRTIVPRISRSYQQKSSKSLTMKGIASVGMLFITGPNFIFIINF